MSSNPDENILHRDLETDAENPVVELATAVADIEGVETTDLPNLWDCVDGVLDNLFSTPPEEHAQMEVTFTYAAYRITVEQSGTARFVKTD